MARSPKRTGSKSRAGKKGMGIVTASASRKGVQTPKKTASKRSSAKTTSTRKTSKATNKGRGKLNRYGTRAGSSNPISTAIGVTSDVAAGAVRAGADVASAAADMVKSATQRLANAATGGVRGPSQRGGGADQARTERGTRKGSSRKR
jgi:hypothetical protein